MKLVLSAFVLSLMLTITHTSFCMTKEKKNHAHPKILSFTKNTDNEDTSCEDLAIDTVASFCTGSAAACTAYNTFNNPVAGPLAFGVTAFMTFAICSLLIPPRKEPDKKEKND